MVARVLDDAGTTTVLVTHDQAEALSFADRVAVLHRGQLVQAGSPQDLYFRPQSPMVAAFLGDIVALPAVIEGDLAVCALGSIAVTADGRAGTTTIFLRPEQLRLVPTTAVDSDGEVIGSGFAGPTSTVIVSLGKRPEPLRVRMSSQDAPPVGTPVKFVVLGKARILP